MKYTWGDAKFATNPNGNIIWANDFGWWIITRREYREIFPTTGRTLAEEEFKFNEQEFQEMGVVPEPLTTDYPDINFR